MPGFITHYICGQAVARAVTPDAREIINRYECVYNMGTQGPDIFFYYLPGLIKKRTRGVGSLMHQQHTGNFILCMADSLCHEKKSEEQHMLFAYTAGYLTHYALDAAAHPYVYARTAIQRTDGPKRSLKGSVAHRKFETAIDILMLKILSSEKPSDYTLWQLVRADARHARTVSQGVSAAIKTAYAREVNPQDVYNAMRYMIQLTRLLQSRKGRRKRFMTLLENLTVGEAMITSIIHDQTVEDTIDYLNMGKNEWQSPWERQQSQNESFVELYHKAIADAAEMVSLLYEYMVGSVTRGTLLKRIGSRSLSTGAECVPS